MNLDKDIALLVGMEGARLPNVLRGTSNDLDLIEAMLPAGFDRIRVDGRHATRRTVLRLLYGLIPRAQRRQIVIAMSCHGGLAQAEDGEHPFLVTNDHPREDGSFGGIFAVELWAVVAAIAARTPFVTVILDCCHAEGIARGRGHMTAPRGRVVGKSAPPDAFPWPDQLGADHPGFTSFRAWLDQLPADLLDSNGHPGVVRVSATAPDRPAYELRSESGESSGLLTRQLYEVLRSCETTPSWQQAVAFVRARMTRNPATRWQRPEVTGPAGRLVFRRSDEARATTSVELDGAGAWLSSGRLHGTAAGDHFTVATAHEVVELEVIDVDDHRARVDRAWASRLSPGSLARLLRRARPAPIAITADDEAARLHTLLSSSSLLAPHDALDDCLSVALRDEQCLIRGVDGRLECITSCARVLTELDACVRAQAFARRCWTPPGLATPERWSVRVHRTHADAHDELHGHELVHVGDRLWFECVNASAVGTRLFFNVVELRVDGHAHCRNDGFAPAGLPVPAGRVHALHRRVAGPPGYRLEWPSHTPCDGERWFQLVIVVSNHPIDLRPIMNAQTCEPLVHRGPSPTRDQFRWDSCSLALRLAPPRR